jgi:hypothetical protein
LKQLLLIVIISICVTLSPASTLQTSETMRLDRILQGARPCQIDGAPRPSVLLSKERLNQLRVQIQGDAEMTSMYQQTVKANADRWVGRKITIPERAGYYHDFVCEDGTRFTVPADQVFPETTGTFHQFTCPVCGRNYSSSKIEGGMRCQQHMWLIAACRDLAFAGAVEQDNRYSKKAAEILLKYADAYPGRHTSNLAGGILYQSLDEAVSFITLAQAYDLIYDRGVLTRGQKQHIEHDLLWECAEGLIHCGVGGNWGSWHLSAVGVIGVATRHQRYIDYGIAQFKKQMREQLGVDGLWPESVHTYHFYPMRGFLHLAEACANTGLNIYNWQTEDGRGLHAMFVAPLSYMYPNFQLPAINDGWFHSFLPLDIYEIGYERYHDAKLGWAVQQLRKQGNAVRTQSPDVVDIWSVIHHVSVPADVSTPDIVSVDFPVLGIAVLRTRAADFQGQAMMTFDYGPFLGHGQADKMGFTWYTGGKLLVADYGTPSYGSTILPYYKGTSSHNTIMVDGKDQPHTKAGVFRGLGSNSDVQFACAETTEIASGVLWRRTVLLTQDYGAVLDQLQSQSEHQFDWLMHCEGAELDIPNAKPSSMPAEKSLKFFNHLTRQQVSGSNMRANWKSEGADGLSFSSILNSSTEVFTAKCPAESAARQVPGLVLRERSRNATFACAFAAASRQVMVEESGGKFIIKTGIDTDSIAVDDGGVTFSRNDGKQARFTFSE